MDLISDELSGFSREESVPAQVHAAITIKWGHAKYWEILKFVEFKIILFTQVIADLI